MKYASNKTIKVALLLLFSLAFSAINAYSQGFDWQYSYRTPSESPRFFGGIALGYDFANYTADVNFSETEIPCCRFRDGDGKQFNIAISAEYWLSGGDNALNFSLGYSKNSGTFSANPDPVFYLQDTLRTKLESEVDISYLQLRLGGKHRIRRSHCWVGANVSADINLSGSFKNSESVTTPNHAFNDGSIKREINDGHLPNLAKFILSPEIAIGYDVNLGLGLYASPRFSIAYNLNSLVQDDSWHSIKFGLGICVYRGIML